MTQHLAQRHQRSDIHDDAVLTLPIQGLPVQHPSGSVAAQPPAPQANGTVIAGVVLGVVALIVCALYAGVFTSAAAQTTAVHQVTYEVTTAKGSKIAATYSRSQHDGLASATVSGSPAPWSANAQVSGVMGPTLTASLSPDPRHAERSDTITCTIVEDGVQVAQNSASGTDAMVTCTK